MEMLGNKRKKLQILDPKGCMVKNSPFIIDAPPNSLIDSTVSPKVKTIKVKKNLGYIP
jgi:hypothetical protein